MCSVPPLLSTRGGGVPAVELTCSSSAVLSGLAVTRNLRQVTPLPEGRTEPSKECTGFGFFGMKVLFCPVVYGRSGQWSSQWRGPP